jgi:hypothetical protein
MSQGFLLVAFGYAVFAVAVGVYEWRRTRANGIDAISLFVVIFMLQCCFSAIAIYSLLPFVDPTDITSVRAFNRILGRLDVPTAATVLCLTASFLMFVYLGSRFGRVAMNRFWPPTNDVWTISMEKRRISALLLLGMLVIGFSFWQLGDSMLVRYTNLILLRSNDPTVERTALNANAFSVTQTWAWLSLIAIFCMMESRWRKFLVPVFIVFAVVFAVLGVSRRALFLPILMVYLTLVLYSNKWHMRWVMAAAVPLVLWIAFGKNLLAAVAYDNSLDMVAGTYQSWQNVVIRASSDVGITVVESVGTIQHIDLPPRLGSDHVLSMMKIFPERTLGFDIEYPERIVRISTAVLDHPDEADLPPGLFGQMWLDFRLAGPLVWGLVFGLQLSVIQWLLERIRCTRQSAAVLVVLVFIVALPVNTGSFDFTFSVDIVAISLALLLCLVVSRGRLVLARREIPGAPSPNLLREET